MIRGISMTVLVASLAAGSVVPAAAQEVIQLNPVADNTIFEDDPGASNGANASVFAGTELGGSERRALLRFDLSGIPPGALVTDVELRMVMTRTIAGTVEIRVHALAADWGEGAADGAMGGGGGAAAGAGDATWSFRFFDSDPWNSPGGDFDPAPVSLADVASPGGYLFDGTPAFINLVQSWVDGTRPNDGVILLADPSVAPPTAKRFGSRENANPDNRPRLIVSYQSDAVPLAVSGLWYDPALDGEGYNIIQSGAGTVIFFYGHSADGQRLWLVSETDPSGLLAGVPRVLEMFSAPPGLFEVPTPSTELTSWGTLTVTLSSCTDGTFVLSGNDGDKTSNVIKLAGIEGTTCEDSP